MATTVVPWVMASRSAGSIIGASGSSDARRSSSRKFGPGSSSARKRGAAMAQGTLSSAGQVLGRPPQPLGVLAELADALVAVQAEQAPEAPRHVAVVDVQRRLAFRSLTADRAH